MVLIEYHNKRCYNIKAVKDIRVTTNRRTNMKKIFEFFFCSIVFIVFFVITYFPFFGYLNDDENRNWQLYKE